MELPGLTIRQNNLYKMLNTGSGPQWAFNKCYSHFCPTREKDAVKKEHWLPLTIAAKTSQPTSPATLHNVCSGYFISLSATVGPGVSRDADGVQQWRLHGSVKNKQGGVCSAFICNDPSSMPDSYLSTADGSLAPADASIDITTWAQPPQAAQRLQAACEP